MPTKKLIVISPQEINEKDKTFCLSFPLLPFPLAFFIRETGFLSPLVLRKEKAKGYQIVLGFKRMAALKKTKRIPAFVFSGKELPNKKAILLSFYENLSERRFNEIEKSIAIEKLRSLAKITDEKLIKFFLPLLGLPRNKDYLKNYLRLGKLEEAAKKAVAQREISVEVGIILAGLCLLERKLFFSLIKRLRLNQNKARIIIALLEEIGRREEKSIALLLREKPVQSPQDFPTLRNYLLTRRYPEFKAYEKRFFGLVKGLKLPSKIKIIPPPFFEEDRLKVNLEIKEHKELKEILSYLNSAFQKKEFGEILSMF
ncbi:MAG: ParB N-terminal domain-containing protein [Candidatus Ratteibacteria bacterium]|nr:ParB N-terminal domain-containing protein [Candidatus Ratteibacteria bacterium]